jgi:methyl-accepting chemotaxis protein
VIHALRRWLQPEAPQPAAAAPDSRAPGRVMDEIEQSRERVSRRVAGLEALTEREILGCGRVLSSIVEHVREVIAETDHALAASMARADESTSAFIREMRADIEAQQAAVAQVLELADGMQEAIESINKLSQYSNLLAINSRIEAARIGDEGAGFAVIADHTRELSKTIRVTADRVSESIGGLRRGLPPVGERASAMRERAQAFIDTVGDQVKSASSRTASGAAGSQRLEAVMRLSNEALSHLQFQDPVAQSLSAIGGDLELLSERVRRVLAGEGELEAVHMDSPAGHERPAPGKITLFQEEHP